MNFPRRLEINARRLEINARRLFFNKSDALYNYRYYGIINDFILSYMCFFLSRREHDDVVSLSRTMSRPRNKFLFAPGSGEKERESENPETLNQSRVPIIISLWNY